MLVEEDANWPKASLRLKTKVLLGQGTKRVAFAGRMWFA